MIFIIIYTYIVNIIIFKFVTEEYISSSEKFLSFYKEIMDTRHFSFYVILSNYVCCTLFDRLGFMFV